MSFSLVAIYSACFANLRISLIPLFFLLIALCLIDRPETWANTEFSYCNAANPNQSGLGAVIDDTIVSNSPQRVWNSANGQFQQSGRLIEVSQESVRLETPDQKQIVVKIILLSEADRDFIAAEADRMKLQANPFKVVESNPFLNSDSTAKENRSATATRENDSTVAFSQPAIEITPDFLQLQLIQLESENGVNFESEDWQAKSPPLTQFQVPSFSFHTRVMGIAVNANDTRIALMMHEPFGIDLTGGGSSRTPSGPRRNRIASKENKSKNWIEMFDLQEKKSLGRHPIDVPDRSQLLDIDPTGKFFLICAESTRNDFPMMIFELVADKFELRTSWTFSAKKPLGWTPKIGLFLPDGKLMLGYNDKLEIWNLNPIQLLHLVSHDRVNVKMTNDRIRAIIQVAGNSFEIRLLEGRCLGNDKKSNTNSNSATDPDGKRIANFANGELEISDLQGKPIDRFLLPGVAISENMSWLDPNTIRIVNTHHDFYIDIDRRVVFLQISKMGQLSGNNGWSAERIKTAGDTNQIVKWVSPSVAEKLDLAKYRRQLPDDPNSLLLLTAGDRVKLLVDLKADPQLSAKVTEKLEGLLKQRGVIIDPNSDLILHANSISREEEVEFQRIGFMGFGGQNVEKAKVKETTQALVLTKAGKVVYRRGSSNGRIPMMLQLKTGETVQQAVDRQTGKPESFWNSIKLPEKIVAHPNGMPYHVVSAGKE